ncbi:MW1434 family type I TA system toxin [Streptosporangium sp. NPDC002524]|uniref:Thoeris anti-defense Tad2 family protein n=1 Tax=Streptosporangium sp. NPDC002524 TaxID=3154537 RepID=UPI003319CC43
MRLADLEQAVEDRRAGVAERALRKVAELAAQHLASTRPQGGRPAVLGFLAGGPAVAHLAELVLAITGPPPGRAGAEFADLRPPDEPPQSSTPEAAPAHPAPVESVEEGWVDVTQRPKWTQVLLAVEKRYPLMGELFLKHCTAADMDEGGAFAEERTVRVTFDSFDALDQCFLLRGHALLAEVLHEFFGRRWKVEFRIAPEPSQSGPAAAPSPAPSMPLYTWMAALDVLKQREPWVWAFLAWYCVGISVGTDEALDDGKSKMVLTFDHPNTMNLFFLRKEGERRFPQILEQVLAEVTGWEWWVAAEAAAPPTAPAPADEVLIKERMRQRLAERGQQDPAAAAPPAPSASVASDTWLAALDLVKQREPLVWNFLARHCVGLTADPGTAPGADPPKLMLTFENHEAARTFSERFVIYPGRVQEYWRILGEALREVTGQQWLLRGAGPTVPLVYKLAQQEQARQEQARTGGGFGAALEQLRAGRRVAREGWNGHGMFVVLQKGYPDGIPINKNTAEATGMVEGTVCAFRPYLMMKTANDEFVPWVASQSDLLAEDWAVVE